MEKPALTLRQIGNLSFGFFGIQFGWGLQMANMSAIYEHLGARADQIPMLWLAAPLTGLLVQPVIGHMSDRTWNRLGRRRPYFLAGALLSSAGLLAMPHASALWMAAILLWVLDASINISMEPFRAFVADLLPPRQRAQGFAMQSLFIGLGAVIASALPYLLTNYFHIGGGEARHGVIPASVKLSFDIGAAVFLGAVLWTIFTTKEYPPEEPVAPHREGLVSQARQIAAAVAAMPATMRRLAAVQISTWLGLFCMWLYFPVAVAHNVFAAPNDASALYRDGAEWAGICFAMYSAVCFLYSFLLPALAARLGRKTTHVVSLLCGAAGLISVAFIHSKYPLLASMTGIGIAWASILAMPYAILAGALPPAKMGTYMGVFNFSIVLPEIIASLGFGWVMNHWLHNNRLAAVVSGGAFLILAALLMARVDDETAPQTVTASQTSAEGVFGAAGA
jgi:maltose/moltooligosaccharide transporter